jgi:hypothetical protein
MMNRLSSLLVVVTALSATQAYSAMYVSGSVSASSANAGLMSYDSRGGSASLAMDIGRFMRLGFTHRQQFQESRGYVGKDENYCTSDDVLDEKVEEGDCLKYQSKTHVIGNSIDLTVILYDGQVFVPFLLGGAVIKTYSSETKKEGEDDTVIDPETYGPVPNIGAGIGIKLNKEFQLKLTYQASPGLTLLPDGTKRSVWDKDTSLGLSYQF